MSRIEFTVPGTAKSTQTGSIFRTKDGRCFPSRRNPEYSAKVALFAQQAKTKEKWVCATGPIKLEITVARQKPKKMPEWLPTSRPDIDNLIKGVMDAMNGIFYTDDKQVVSLHVYKVWAEKEPYVDIEVEKWE